MIIEYKTGVHTPAGWRSIDIRARVELTSPKMAKVVEVIEVDGQAPARHQSRTGAKRQAFSGTYIAQREIGATKRLSSCTIIEEAKVS